MRIGIAPRLTCTREYGTTPAPTNFESVLRTTLPLSRM